MKYNKGFVGIGVIIAIVVALAVGGGVVYYATKTPAPSLNTEENNYQSQANQNQQQTNTQNPPVNNQSNQTSNWKTYTNSNYSIKYPSQWSINSSKGIPANEYEGSTVLLTKENHTFKIYIPSAYSPSVCIFKNDTPSLSGETSYVKFTGDYLELKSTFNTFRRSTNPKTTGNGEEQIFSICQKEKNSNVFTTSNIHYYVPKNYNTNLVSQMDEMLKTFEDK